jgi:hypothetical protein
VNGTDVATCVRISLGLTGVLGERCMRSATGHDEQRAPAGGTSAWLEAASTLYFSVGRRLCSDLVSRRQGFQPYKTFSVLPFGPTVALEARLPSDRSLRRPDRASAAGAVGGLHPNHVLLTAIVEEGIRPARPLCISGLLLCIHAFGPDPGFCRSR